VPTQPGSELAYAQRFQCAESGQIANLDANDFIYKLVYWDRFSVGTAPLVIGIFFLISIQLICLGIVGEYIGSIHTMVQNRPLVIEKERINFDDSRGCPRNS
jgi:hypothetical protein